MLPIFNEISRIDSRGAGVLVEILIASQFQVRLFFSSAFELNKFDLDYYFDFIIVTVFFGKWIQNLAFAAEA
jgi:hypothetical protein